MKGFESSYMALRKAVGILGISLPVILFGSSIVATGYVPFQGSISCYYHTPMRNVFEGILWIFAIILVFYDYRKKDNIITTIAGICALGIALSPTHVKDCITCTGPSEYNNISGYFHDGFTIAFFLLLSYVSLFLFTKTNTPTPTPEKKKRNKVYKATGIIMLACIGLIIIYSTLKCTCLDSIKPVLLLETIALWSFGASWIIKGELFLKDKVH